MTEAFSLERYAEQLFKLGTRVARNTAIHPHKIPQGIEIPRDGEYWSIQHPHSYNPSYQTLEISGPAFRLHIAEATLYNGRILYDITKLTGELPQGLISILAQYTPEELKKDAEIIFELGAKAANRGRNQYALSDGPDKHMAKRFRIKIDDRLFLLVHDYSKPAYSTVHIASPGSKTDIIQACNEPSKEGNEYFIEAKGNISPKTLITIIERIVPDETLTWKRQPIGFFKQAMANAYWNAVDLIKPDSNQ